MKKLEMIVRPERFEELKSALDKVGVHGITVTEVMGCGNQKGHKEIMRGQEVSITLLHKFKVEVFVNDSQADAVIAAALVVVNTGRVGDGKIFIESFEDAVRIRTGEQGEIAI
ncbi:MAG: P-II family nitrogen regulator [Hyphomonadaceae bacterium]|nr:P-II family nitrogen regulator [Clostridia bacterium]